MITIKLSPTVGTYDKSLFTEDLLEDTITFTVENLTPSKIFRVCGYSNNWLKMHGYPMIRKRTLFLASYPTKPR